MSTIKKINQKREGDHSQKKQKKERDRANLAMGHLTQLFPLNQNNNKET